MYGGCTMTEVIHKNLIWGNDCNMWQWLNMSMKTIVHIQSVKISDLFVNDKNYHSIGLTILLPYIISTRSNWETCKIRIFALANHKQDIGAQEKE